MKASLAAFGLMLTAMAACAPLPKESQAPSPPGPETAEAAAAPPAASKPDDLEEPEMKALPPTDVRVMKCSVINSASDDDKAYASTFLLGYRSAMVHRHLIDTRQIDQILQAAVADCAAKPDAVAYKVFAAVQTKVEASERAEHPERAPHVVHHRMPSLTPAMAAPAAQPPAPAAPETQPAPTQALPPMRYAPAVITPPIQSMPPLTPPARPDDAADKPDKPADKPEKATGKPDKAASQAAPADTPAPAAPAPAPTTAAPTTAPAETPAASPAPTSSGDGSPQK